MKDTIYRSHVLICTGTGCVSSGAKTIKESLEEELAANDLTNEIKIVETGCHGFCEKGPIMIVYPEGVFYCELNSDDVAEIVEEHLLKGRTVERLLFKEPMTEEQIPSYQDIDFYKKQQRIALANCGQIDPEDINEYIALGGYEAAGKVLTEMSPQEVVDTVKDSGLRGRGGGGFPTGLKWQFAKNSESDKKYLICNADEGDPGAFMDRSILEGDPHRIIEGMIVGAYAIGADEGYVYVRAEYPLAIKRLQKAIEDAEEYGLLGDDIFSSGFNFKLHIKKGAGAFVCGEETALMNSIEGKRGMPTPRPPYPAVKGLWGKPTNINNVETYANIPFIIAEGAESFSAIGTEGSSGTKVFALTGKINNTGLVEVPMGTTIKEVIFEIGGGITEGKKFKAIQTGGPSGGCLTEDYLDLPIDYDSLLEAGAMMGSGGMVVMDEDSCMVDVARFFLNFTESESCGKCTPCREGTKRMLEILNRITSGEGKDGDIELLLELGDHIKNTALCGLGQTAPNPVLSTIRYFRDEYEAHIHDHTCPAGACTDLVSSYVIDEEACIGCGKCAKVCPVDAISGEIKSPFTIDADVCIACGACEPECPVDAISQG
ncbi:NADH-quinone oxidoreductase subunit NuoF [Halanaerobium congolense]|jgi:NADP-reducing hydrogenase subunit HndC|uniref:NADP-reducing hydrogenase subunit HndC n=1 Tax=Halanaerobium congolense TaxID=54121 RepID=A0A1G9XXB8_9FIRM|nr:NADH-quinone oxidoreductase subunit NuoF [Halanaerobium congolense]PXV60217.1 NADP-reducing hydrogenase subunit HndC [Halanaerobium congolense]TDP21633.1 NADP-reducing hydrogenase subunit HndC [Halanaerobium congolense]SDG89978.1 NADP-reducing hydrogenase subunit HndC [Halanaerobium congolense]SDK99049.1 NADP-reducing hydrogenase subunit HndC [Halanaerobium congolense]SDN01482.1 NADP-reducing hydrogenase subunit HndC [Halanaerobium congolense]